MKQRGKVIPVSRVVGKALARQGFFCIDSADCAGSDMERFRCFNPFYTWGQAVIPVPGQVGLWSRSVESIWQGLKLIDQKVELGLMNSTPTLRPPKTERAEINFKYPQQRFLYHNHDIDIIQARYFIYVPAYKFLLDQLVDKDIFEHVGSILAKGEHIFVYDWDDNFDINDPSRAFSHSMLIALYVNGDFHDQLMMYAPHAEIRQFLGSMQESTTAGNP